MSRSPRRSMSTSCSISPTAPQSATATPAASAHGSRSGASASGACAVQGPRHRAARPRLHRRVACLPAQGQDDLDQGGAHRSEADRRARQHLCLRGAVSRRHLADTGSPARSPPRPASRPKQPRRSSKPIKSVLGEAIKAGGSTLRDYARADGRLGRFQHRFKVYGREGKPCPRKGCRGTVRRIVQRGRSTFYCPNCQR